MQLSSYQRENELRILLTGVQITVSKACIKTSVTHGIYSLPLHTVF